MMMSLKVLTPRSEDLDPWTPHKTQHMKNPFLGTTSRMHIKQHKTHRALSSTFLKRLASCKKHGKSTKPGSFTRQVLHWYKNRGYNQCWLCIWALMKIATKFDVDCSTATQTSWKQFICEHTQNKWHAKISGLCSILKLLVLGSSLWLWQYVQS